MDGIKLSIISIIQEFCAKKGYYRNLTLFAQAFSQKYINIYEERQITSSDIHGIIDDLNDFAKLNGVSQGQLKDQLVHVLEINKAFITKRKSLLDVLIDFKLYAEGNLVRPIKDPKIPNEEFVRSILQAYLPKHGFRESESRGGNSDIVVAEEKAVIETKLWKSPSQYEDGKYELVQYLKGYGYKTGFYVVFLDKPVKTANEIQTELPYHKELIEGLSIVIFFIDLCPPPPSRYRKSIINNK